MVPRLSSPEVRSRASKEWWIRAGVAALVLAVFLFAVLPRLTDSSPPIESPKPADAPRTSAGPPSEPLAASAPPPQPVAQRASAPIAAPVLAVVAPSASAVADEAPLAPYARKAPFAGNLTCIGSDAMNELITFWLRGYREIYPNITSTYDPKGSGAAPTALIEGTAAVGPMSRAMKPEEIEKFRAKFGYEPTFVRVALDAIAILVHADNPISSLTLPQLDAIFSSTRKSGAPADITTWRQLGLTGEWDVMPISLYGRNSASAPYGFFKERVFSKGNYKASVNELPGSASVVNGVATDHSGIGYAAVGYRTPSVRSVPLVGDDGHVYDATNATVRSGAYPLARPLYLYVNNPPGRGRGLDPMVREFLIFVTSREGQAIAAKAGFVPITALMAVNERMKIE
jgi:phosphate transport system substrate-binding protein